MVVLIAKISFLTPNRYRYDCISCFKTTTVLMVVDTFFEFFILRILKMTKKLVRL